MRTDSTTLSDEAIRAARSQAASMFGDDYVADHPRRYDRKVKNAQEAHEAIRPAGESFRTLDEAQHQLHGDERALYDLIWKRTIASQMVDARLTQDRVRLTGTLTNVVGYDGNVELGLAASGLRIEFAGFRRAYVEGTDDPEAELADQERILPALSEGARVPVASAEAKAHDTQPPDRYSEATLIKKLEDLGIGRPSTYASVMKTIDRRGYVWKKGKSLVPTFRAFAVVNLLEHYFADLVDYQFTAAMEDQLDEIAQGRQDLEPWLRKFYFGDETADSEFARLGLEHMTHEPHEFDFAAINSLSLGVAPDGLPVSVRSGRYGPYLVHGEDRVSIPEATEPDSLTVERALELLAAPSNDRELGTDDEGETIYLKAGRYGPYVQIGEMTDPKEKPAPHRSFRRCRLRPSRSRTQSACSPYPATSAITPRAVESSLKTGATAHISRGARRRARSKTSRRSFPSISTARWRCSLSPSSGDVAPRQSRWPSLAKTPRRSVRSSCAVAASVSTSPTARRTRPFELATRPRPSRWIVRASFSPNDATRSPPLECERPPKKPPRQ